MPDRVTSARRLPHLVLLAVTLGVAPALAQNATWDGSGLPGLFNDADNWTPAGVPTGTATFAGANPTNIVTGFGSNLTVGQLAITAGSYSLTPGLFSSFTLDGAGITNSSSNAFTINLANAFLEFQNSATAGNATINASVFSIVSFANSSSAGAGTITLIDSLAQFLDNATAGTANISVGGFLSQLSFGGNSTAGSSAITVQGGSLLLFQGTATGGNATITVQNGAFAAFGELSTGGNARFVIEAGGAVGLSGLFAAAAPTMGSIEGAGTICLCNSILTIGSNNRSTEFSGIISSGGGPGGLAKVGSGTLILSGVNDYLGPTTVSGGTLVVNGSIASSSLLTVNAGGAIGGTGQLPSTVIAGGTLSPGSSVGTVTVNGNLTLGAGSTYLVEVDTAAADRTNVTGAATITGSTVRFIRAGGALNFFQRYTILNAAGGVTGTFQTIDNQLGPAIRTTVSYDPNNVFLTLDPNALLAVLGGTPLTINQRSVATGIDNAVFDGADPSAFLPLFALPAGSIPAALDQLGGEVHTARTALGFDVSDQFLRVMLDPFALGRRRPAGPALSYGPGALSGTEALVAATQAADLAAAEPVFDTRRFALWASAFGSDSRVGGDSVIGSHRLSSRNVNLAIGADWRAAPDTILGIAASGGSADASVAGLGSLSAEVGQAGAYVMTRFAGLNIGAALAYSLIDIDSNRTVPVLGLTGLTADYTVHAFSGRIEASFAAAHVGDMVIAPLAAFQAHAIRTPGFVERTGIGGQPAAALAVQGDTQHLSRSELGVRLQGRLPFEALAVTGFARFAWAHYFERDATIAAAFVGLAGSNFVITGARPDRDSALISAGFDVRVTPAFALGARFDGEFSGNVSRLAGSARARLEF